MPPIDRKPIWISDAVRREAAKNAIVRKFKRQADEQMIRRLTEALVTAHEAIFLGHESRPQVQDLADTLVRAALDTLADYERHRP